MGLFKEIATVVILGVMLLANVYALWKWKNEFVSKEDFKPLEYMKAKDFVAKCKKCKEDLAVFEGLKKVAANDVILDIKNIKIAVMNEARDLRALGVVQIAMCRHIGMDQEEINMLKDALKNGVDITSLL